MYPRPRKRVRLDRTSEYGEGEQIYRAGSIRRIDLVQFQVCQKASYLFGPNLNLVVSPNGSGKSTAVIALFVVFLGKVSVINRSDLKDFIKSGCDFATATVHVQGKDAPDHVHTVTVQLRDNGGSRTSVERFIDGRSASDPEIFKFCQEYNIHVNNLCVFLLQDRVSAFSSQTSQDLLRATEVSVGTHELEELHDALISAGQKSRDAEQTLTSIQERLAKCQQDAQTHSAILEQLTELRTRQDQIKELDHMIIIARNMGVQQRIDAIKDKVAALVEEISGITAHLAPFVESCRAQEESAATEVITENGKLKQIDANLSRQLEALASQKRRLQGLYGDFKSLKDQKHALENRIVRDTQNVRDCVKAVAEEEARKRSPAEIKELETKHGESKQRYDNLELLRAQNQKSKQELVRRLHAHSKEQERVQRDITSLQNYSQKQLDDMTALYGATSDFRNLRQYVKFVQDHASEFTDRVYEPAVLSLALNSTDPRILKVISTAVTPRNLMRFVCTNRHDYEKLSTLFSDFKLDGVVANGSNAKPRSFYAQGPFYREQGFDGVITDLFDGPWPVLEQLYSLQLHKMPYSLSEVSGGASEWFFEQGGTSYVDMLGITRQRKSKYGSKEAFSTRESLKEPSAHISFMSRCNKPESLRAEKLASLKSTLSGIMDKISETAQEQESLSALSETRISEHEVAKREFEEVLSELQRAKRTVISYQSAVTALEKAREQEQQHKDDTVGVNTRLEGIAKKMTTEAAVLVSHHKLRTAQSTLCESVNRSLAAELRKLAAKGNGEVLHQASSSLQIEKRQRQEELEAELREIENGRGDMATKDADLRRTLGADVYRALRARCAETSLQALRIQLETLEADVALQDQGHNYERSKSIYEQARKDAAELGMQLQTLRNSSDSSRRQTEEIKQRYESQITGQIDQISAKFHELFYQITGCEGHVDLDKTQNFEDWGLNIKVSFRIGHAPSVLSTERHSGGERALSTALYLMSLQDLTSSPFCVVDELNQGMDEANERSFHNLLVALASRDSCRDQYIVITPKLLLGLDYNDRVHLITSFNSSTVNVSENLCVPDLINSAL